MIIVQNDIPEVLPRVGDPNKASREILIQFKYQVFGGIHIHDKPTDGFSYIGR